MKYLKKTLSFVLAFAMAFTMVIVPKDSGSVADAATEYGYFDTTLFKYDIDTFNKATWDKESAVEGNKYTIKQLTSADFANVTNNDSGIGFLERNNCIIVSNNHILHYNNGSIDGVSCMKDDENILTDETLLQEFLQQYGSTVLWTFSEPYNSQKNIITDADGATNKYLYYNNGFKMTSTESKLFNISENSIKYNNNYNLGYSDGWKNVSGSIKIYQISRQTQGIYFNEGSAGTYIDGYGKVSNKDYNKWTGLWDASGNNNYSRAEDKLYTASNLVKPELTKSSDGTAGQIQFNYPQAGIFDEKDKTGKKVYEEVEIPFVKGSNGYYEYDSSKYGVQFNGDASSNTRLSVTNANGGFFPFGTTSDETKFHFGMNMGVNFYMTKDGKINNQDIQFNFSGDDDVWVFVDGKLVLDIGGIHDAVAGSINFRTGAANVYVGKTSTIDKNKSIGNIYETLFGTTAKAWREQDKMHTLQVFYLERGAGVSNCKIGFNLPLQDTLEVKKVLGNEDKQDGVDNGLNALKDKEFTFQLYTTNANGEYVACVGKKYDLYDGNGYNKTTYTGDNGDFVLKPGQIARFVGAQTNSTDSSSIDLTGGNKYKVIEVNDNTQDYQVSWKTSTPIKNNSKIETTTANGTGNEAKITTISKDATDEAVKYRFEFSNEFEPSLQDDVVVLDYGEKVKIDVFKNDNLLGATRFIKKIDSSNCHNGTLSKSGDGKLLIYEPIKYMNSVDTATYTVNINNISESEDKTANVSIMPANSVYYEDDFGKIQDSNSGEGDPSVSIVWKGEWDTDVNESGNESGNKESDRYQDFNNEQRHGWDSHYVKDKEYSGGSAHYSSDYTATATFRFTGTDVDVYSRTNESVGKIIATITRVDEKASTFKPKTKIVNNLATSGDYYQVPTLNFSDLNLEYGTYEVKIQVDPVVDENGQFIYKKDESGNYVLDSDGNKILLKAIYYLDGIRVYNPLGVAPNDTRVENAYSKAGEYNALFKEVRDMLISADTFSNDANVEGAVFIDDINGQPVKDGKVSDFKTYGPENEVYLAKGQAIAFKIDTNYTGKAFIGLKSLEGKDVSVTITDGDKEKDKINLKHTTDMYYEVKPTTQKYIVITNSSESDNLLAVTRLRLTGIQDTQNNSIKVSSNAALVKYVSDFSSLKTNKTDESGMIIGDDSGDVDIDNPENPEKPDEPENPEKPDDNKDHNTPNKIWNKLLEYIKHWFRK